MKRSATAIVLLATALAGCRGAPEAPSAPELVAVPRPVLADREAAVRDQLIERRERLDRLLADAAASPLDLARAFGELGRYYHAYALSDAAQACYANAGRLDDRDPRWSYYAGLLHEDKGELDRAATRFEAVLALRPTDLPTLLRLGELRLQQNRPDEARDCYERALATDAGSAAAHYGLGRVAALGKDYRTAAGHFEAALMHDPQASVIHYPLAQAYRNLGRADDATRHLELRGQGSVAFDDPLLAELGRLTRSSGAFLRTGSTAFLEERFEDAARDYRKAVDADPANAEARKSLGAALTRLGRAEEAIEQYRTVLELEPENPLIRYNLAWLRAGQGDVGAAIDEYRKTVALDPDFKEAHLNLALLLEGEGRQAEALSHLDRVLILDPQNRTAMLHRPQLLTALDRRDEALTGMGQAVAADPTHAEARLALGTALSGSGEGARAERELEEALRLGLDPADAALAEYNLGVLLGSRGEDRAALFRYERAIDLDPTLVEAQFHRANVLGREGRFTEAADGYRAVLDLEPTHLPARLATATALLLGGSCVDARRALEAGLEVMPDEPNLTHTLARILSGCRDARARDGARAVTLALDAHRRLEMEETAETVAMAYAEAGDFAQAAEWQRRLIAQAEARGEIARTEQLRARLALYESGRPFRL